MQSLSKLMRDQLKRDEAGVREAIDRVYSRDRPTDTPSRSNGEPQPNTPDASPSESQPRG